MASRALNVAGTVAAVAVILGAFGYAWWADREVYEAPARRPEPAAAATPVAAPEGAHPAPYEVFAGAQVGDWQAYTVEMTGPLAPTTHTTVMVTVSAVDGDRVTRALHGRVDATGEERDEGPDRFARTGLTLEQLTGADLGDWTLSDVAVTDDVREVAGRRFACKRVTFASRDPLFPRKVTRTELWLSTEVPAGGLIAEREVQDLDQMHFTMSKELIGFGTATATTWGTRPAGW